jgi:cellulose 1,4-beta-cellobiosidase
VGGGGVDGGIAGSRSTGGASGSGGSTGGAGAGGSAGAGGARTTDAGQDAGPVGICNYANPITLLYRWWPNEAGASRLDFSFKLVNGSAQTISLDSITARYYLTNEIAAPSATVVYGDVCCPDKIITSHVTAKIVAMNPPALGADTYVELAFDATAGTLAPAHSLEVEVEFANATGSASTTSNDYSYIATATGSQAQWDNCPSTGNCMPFRSCVMTAYQAGTLIWGNPPQ